jgi:type I restriction enzyme R subunit
MVVTSGIVRAIQYFHAFREYLEERKSPCRAIVPFSGEHEYGGAKVTEASLNGFPSGDIADRIQEDPYRFLICADKFQTGYDEPLLHTMYVDKPLAGVKAVQTLPRLNRAHPQKHDVFVLDFMNNTETITAAFSDYYRTTVLSEETDKAKAFTRTYDFLASILPYNNAGWEKLSILLTFLIPKLPAPVEEDLSKGILEAIDMDSYRAEKKAAMKISLPDTDAEIGPVPTSGGGRKPEPELDRLSNILKTFNEHFGTLFTDADRVVKRIKDDIAPKVAADQGNQNAKKNTPNTARLEHDKALQRVMVSLLKDDTELYKHFVQNESFRRFVTDMVFTLTSA